MTHAELALDADGRFLALSVHTIANMGAYLSMFASCIPTILYATLLAGQYTRPAIFCEVTAAFTNTAPVDAYRGAGRPEATFVVERIVHQAAVETGIAQDELRRRNFVRSFPYQTPVALSYDTGDYDKTLDGAMQLADVAGFAARKVASEKAGKLRGLGYASYIEACGLAPSNIAIVKALDKVVAKGRKIAAHLLEAAEVDIEFKDGRFAVAGTDRSKAFGEVALAAYVPHNYPARHAGAGPRRNGVLRSDELHVSAQRTAADGQPGAPAASMNAVMDALAGVGVKHLDMPASPHRVWQAIRAAKQA